MNACEQSVASATERAGARRRTGAGCRRSCRAADARPTAAPRSLAAVAAARRCSALRRWSSRCATARAWAPALRRRGRASVTFASRATLAVDPVGSRGCASATPTATARVNDRGRSGRAARERSIARAAGRRHAPSLLRRAPRALRRPQRNTLAGSRDNIHHHYDIGNDFYALWLGRTMAYTCAYYPTPAATLDEAQVAKMDHVCRKLRLQAGESVVEAGCGWGTLALHMARHYGVRVRAFNISHEQIAYARERAAREGLGDARRVRRGRLSQHHRPLRRLRLGRHARARRARRTTRRSGASRSAASAAAAAA